MTYTTPRKKKPVFHHALIQVSLAVVAALFLSSGYAWDLTARMSTDLLNLAGVPTNYVSPEFSMYVTLLDGTLANFQVLLECSGLVSLLVFTFVSAFTVGLLRGALIWKLIWFALSVAVGFVWNLGRLTSVIAIAYSLGVPAFEFAHYVLAPTIDFVWVVSLWALGMSWLKNEESE